MALIFFPWGREQDRRHGFEDVELEFKRNGIFNIIDVGFKGLSELVHIDVLVSDDVPGNIFKFPIGHGLTELINDEGKGGVFPLHE